MNRIKYLVIMLLINISISQNLSDREIKEVSIVSTSNVFSEYYDCGCPKAPLGGLARKKYFLNNLMPNRNIILIDSGNMFFDSNSINPDNLSLENKKFKARNLVKTLEVLDQEVVNIGANDFKAGLDFLKDITEDSPVNFISANLFDKRTNQLIFKPYHIIDRAGLKIAFIGLSESADSKDLLNKDFNQIGNEYIELLQSKVDIVALLINVRDNNTSLENIYSNFKGANYIFLSGTTLRSEPRTKQYSTEGPFLYAGGIQGKHLSILDIRINDKNKVINDVSASFNRLQEIDYRLNKLRSKDLSVKIEDLYANQPNVLSLIQKYQKEATEIGISLSGFKNRSIFFSVPLAPGIPDDKDVAAFIEKVAKKADFPLSHKH